MTRSNTAYSWVNHINLDTLFGHNGLNQITSITEDGVAQTAPTWDGRGNLTSYAGTSYGYDHYNRLTSVSGGITLSYDPLGRLHSYTTGAGTYDSLYDGAALIGMYNAGSLVQRFVHGPGMDEPLVQYSGAGTSNRTFLHADERGSIIAHTDSAGNRTATLAYDEYGNPGSGNTGLFQYTGQIWLANIGAYYYKNRFYHPGLGRFMQTDPIGQTGGINLYAYVGGDPVNFTDPWGLRRICKTGSDGQMVEVPCPQSWTEKQATLDQLRQSLMDSILLDLGMGASGSGGPGGKGSSDTDGKQEDQKPCNRAAMMAGNFLRSYGHKQQQVGGVVALAGGTIAVGALLFPLDGPVGEMAGGAVAASGGVMLAAGTIADVAGQFLQGYAIGDANYAMGGVLKETLTQGAHDLATGVSENLRNFSRALGPTGAAASLVDVESRMRSC
ncbi:hypothetical protein E5163_10955 [Marinicauda algicola]|uniref:RHS repeat-associated core domain-containing protein n=1 Tax=Marinicauda algicola TaxID=2029849 RepID=A0A4S2GZS2_9PROT|nr:RHS repeat-associated core domain-containing protein [Marinicauda algicola]TGY88332.1 hypothetical protein E5163_10955 [Marinicauda algicola]